MCFLAVADMSYLKPWTDYDSKLTEGDVRSLRRYIQFSPLWLILMLFRLCSSSSYVRECNLVVHKLVRFSYDMKFIHGQIFVLSCRNTAAR